MAAAFNESTRQALLRANELHDEGWQCSLFSTDGNTLALCVFPGRYLVFRGTHFVKLPFVLNGAEFSATEQAGLQKVFIRSHGNEFCVVCEGVAFYEVEYPGGLQTYGTKIPGRSRSPCPSWRWRSRNRRTSKPVPTLRRSLSQVGVFWLPTPTF